MEHSGLLGLEDKCGYMSKNSVLWGTSGVLKLPVRIGRRPKLLLLDELHCIMNSKKR